MIFREAGISDIPQIQVVRHLVKENRLSDPSLVTDEDCKSFLTLRGKGWVCEVHGRVAGFAIADLQDNNIWALFIDPEYEGRGIGQRLQQLMLSWYFSQDKMDVWLSTSPGTRAEQFYQRSGWHKAGMQGKEVRFEMTRKQWLELQGS